MYKQIAYTEMQIRKLRCQCPHLYTTREENVSRFLCAKKTGFQFLHVTKLRSAAPVDTCHVNRICPDKTGAAVHGAIETFGGLSEKQNPRGGGGWSKVGR